MRHIHGIYVGHWAGNLGDSATFDVFDRCLPENIRFTLEVHSLGDWRRRAQTEFVHWQDKDRIVREISKCDVVILLGTTVVTDLHDGEWPISLIIRSLELTKRYNKDVHAIGVGVYPNLREVNSERFRERFVKSLNMASVRDRESQKALLHGGFPIKRIILGADLSWLFDRPIHISDAQQEINSLTESKEFIGINVVHEDWQGNYSFYEALARDLDTVYRETNLIYVFFCNEVREGNLFDRAAASRVIALMKSPAKLCPARWMHPEDMIARLSLCKIAISMRYHFSIFATLAGVPWIGFARGQKCQSLLSEFHKPIDFRMGEAMEGRLAREIISILKNREATIEKQNRISEQLKQRAIMCREHIKFVSNHYCLE